MTAPANQPQKPASGGEGLLGYFWPQPYPQSHPPIQVAFSNGLPESDTDSMHKVFVVPYSLFKTAVETWALRQSLAVKPPHKIDITGHQEDFTPDQLARITAANRGYNSGIFQYQAALKAAFKAKS